MKCPICSDSFTDPRSLLCIHTFCLKCLEQYGRDQRNGAGLSADNSEHQLLRELESSEQEAMKNLDTHGHTISQHAADIKSLKKYTEELLKRGSACDIAARANVVHGRTEELLEKLYLY